MARVSTTNYKLPLRGYNDFRGGWNADAAPDVISDNEMALADDIDLSVRGGFCRRKGHLRLNAVSFGAQAKQTVEYCKNDGAIQMLALIGTDLVLIGEEGWTIDKNIQSGFTRDDIPHYFYGDKMLYVDGDEYRVYDGSESRLVQPLAPTAAPSLGGLGGPTLTFSGVAGEDDSYFYTGTYKALVVFIGADGVVLGLSGETSKKNSDSYRTTIEWAEIPTGPEGTIKRQLYRTKDDEKKFLLIATINNNTATTYSDTKTGGGSSELAFGSGEYKGWVTFVQADGYESDPSPAGVSGQVAEMTFLSWTNIPTGGDGTVARKLYRTEIGGSIGKLVTTIQDNTTTTYTDMSTDDDLSVVAEVRTDYDSTPVKTCDFIIYHTKSGRVFAASKKSADVHYSEQARPEYFRAHVTPTSGDGPVVGMKLFGDALIVQYSNGAWVWRGQDPSTDAIWQKLPTPGAFSHYGIVDTPGTITWIGPGGIYSAPPSILGYGNINVKNEEYNIANFAEKKVQSVIASIGKKDVISAVYDSNTSRVYFAYPEGKSSTANNRILVFDWALKAFTRYTNINAMHLLQRKNGDILASTNGYIVKLNGAVNDPDNTPVKMNFKSKPYHLDHPFHKKRILRLFTEFKAPDTGDVEISFNIYVDSILVYTRKHVSFGESFLWGESVWGEAVWGGRELVATRSKISSSGHRVEVEIECVQLDVPDVVVYGFAFEFRPIRAKGERI